MDIKELEQMLDENLPDDLKEIKRPQYEERFKTVMEEKGHNHFEVLPEGWVQITHTSGIPVYLQRKTRVVSVSRPYYLGPGSARLHKIPLSSIPCLNYKKALEKENEEQLKSNEMDVSETTEQVNGEEQPEQQQEATSIGNLGCPQAKIETVKENFEGNSLASEEVIEYCKQLFKFKTMRILRFKSWNARRKFAKNRKIIKNLQRPTLPEGTNLIKFPILSNDQNLSSRSRKQWILNPNGKSFVCILHEYVQHALKKQPTYEFKELENAATPYSATVCVNGVKYGSGYGTSKKQAKAEAAKETLEILIPDMKEKIPGLKPDKNAIKPNYKDLSVFDDIKITDARVAEFCNKTTEPPPHQILLTCLSRNFGLGDVDINYDIETTRNKKNKFTLTVGKHKATVYCKNKREGKQLASQEILQQLHPHINSWGSLLRLYGNHSIKTFKEKKLEEQEITVLQNKATINQPNIAILDKLRTEMVKLSEKNAAKKTIGIFEPPPDVELPTTSGSNLKNVNL
ncbi:DGCR8 family protein [Megaselia abdita]